MKRVSVLLVTIALLVIFANPATAITEHFIYQNDTLDFGLAPGEHIDVYFSPGDPGTWELKSYHTNFLTGYGTQIDIGIIEYYWGQGYYNITYNYWTNDPILLWPIFHYETIHAGSDDISFKFTVYNMVRSTLLILIKKYRYFLKHIGLFYRQWD